MDDGKKELLSTPELARRLKVSTATIRRLTMNGTIPYIRVGKQFRYDWERVEMEFERETHD